MYQLMYSMIVSYSWKNIREKEKKSYLNSSILTFPIANKLKGKDDAETYTNMQHSQLKTRYDYNYDYDCDFGFFPQEFFSP